MDWLKLVPRGQLKDLPIGSIPISSNGISAVYDGLDGYVYKRSIPYLTENEFAFLDALNDTPFVPMFWRYDIYTIKLEQVEKNFPIKDEKRFRYRCSHFLFELAKRNIRHGDLTRPHILVSKNNEIKVIDWAESRWASDPAPDKRPEGDNYWLSKTMEELINDR